MAVPLEPRVGSPDTPMLPLFSMRPSDPDLSTIAVAVPAVPPRTAMMVPLLVMLDTLAPVSIRIACAAVVAVPAPSARTVPLITSSGTVAPVPIRSAVALASTALAPIVPLIVAPPVTFTVWPAPPIESPVAEMPL